MSRFALVLTLFSVSICCVVSFAQNQPPKQNPPIKDTRTQQQKDADQKEAKEAAQAVAAVGTTIAGIGLVTFAICAIVYLILDLIPIIIAFSRGHPNAAAITAVTLLTSCTGIGWIVALVWSLTAFEPRARGRYNSRGRGRSDRDDDFDF